MYAVAPEAASALRIGSIVLVPFGPRRVQGCVLSLSQALSPDIDPAKIKPIQRILSPEFHVDPGLLSLAQWISEYYLAPIGETIGCVSFLGFNNVEEKTTAELKLAEEWHERLARAAFDELDARDIPWQAEEPLQTRADAAGPVKLSPKQRIVAGCFLSAGNRPMPAAALQAAAGVSRSVIAKLLARGILAVEHQPLLHKDDYAHARKRDAALPLNLAQGIALSRIASAMDAREPRTCVLYGVTGSGKTEVYLQAIGKALDEGGEAVVLVPEISLTPQTVARFRNRFGGTVGVYHSKLTLGQKLDLWQRIKRGECRVMVGARSAVFTPFEHLRIIAIDEEHETSYKQDAAPRYHARDVAIVRAQAEKAVVILGSATPSVETYFKAQTGKFELLTLPERIAVHPLPDVQVIDMTREIKENPDADLIAEPLRLAMNEALGRREQVLLFLNRRGFFNFMVCMDCNAIVRCKHCDVALTHHRPRNVLLCHYCASQYPLPKECAECGGSEVSLIGVGTQRVEERVQELFPKARIIRIDLDSTRRRTAFIDAWNRIERGEADIILGTQMVAKGFHLENVTLVGVPLADVSLFQPDFRCAERAFSILTQVAGRAGRGEKKGHVIVQTYVPYHYAVEFARTHDYPGFYEKEIQVRRVLRFPPHYRLISVLASGKDADRTNRMMKELARQLRDAAFRMQDAVTVLGPAPAPIARIRDEFRYRLLLRGKDHRVMKSVLRHGLDRCRELPGKTAVQFTVDVDPLDLM